mmetsp:Transcript_34274/g.84895  ORF Transcript_34274/g.84895 Transcript_34274/m.84895 type:complete len:201 (+) Transcript_34274:144-746(+)
MCRLPLCRVPPSTVTDREHVGALGLLRSISTQNSGRWTQTHLHRQRAHRQVLASLFSYLPMRPSVCLRRLVSFHCRLPSTDHRKVTPPAPDDDQLHCDDAMPRKTSATRPKRHWLRQRLSYIYIGRDTHTEQHLTQASLSFIHCTARQHQRKPKRGRGIGERPAHASLPHAPTNQPTSGQAPLDDNTTIHPSLCLSVCLS